MKKIISVLLCIAMLAAFMTVFAAAEDAAAPALSGAETIINMLLNLLKQVDWTSVLSVLTATLRTLGKLFGQG